jgi:hypothetical protein
VKVKALDRDGKPYELIAEGLLAVCIQHECDHLNGKLFVDYLSTLKRDRIKKKLEKAPPASLMPFFQACCGKPFSFDASENPMTEPLRIVFAGTPEFAAEHLKALLDSPYEIVAVYTQPDRPAGRGQKLMPSPVKQLAWNTTSRAAAADPAQRRCPGRTGRTEAGLDGGGRLRPDPAASGAGYSAPGLHQQPCLAAATLARCGADPAPWKPATPKAA